MKTAQSTSDQARHQLQANVDIHDRIAVQFEKRHGEIFNEIEQERLHSTLARAADFVTSESKPLRALDFGCGSGNLTRHLLRLGFHVVAADISERFLDVVRERFPSASLSTHRLNGKDLRELPDASMDFVATYSVLHHIPDYLGAVAEMGRVCRPGGVIYIDHEPTEWFWTGDPAYRRFIAEARRTDWRKYLVWGNYVGKVRRLFNPRFTNEGDIHVWPDDHVEWTRVGQLLAVAGCEPVLVEDYLLYHNLYRRAIYERYKQAFADTRVMAFRKL